MGKIKSLRSDILRTPEVKLLIKSTDDPRVRYLIAMLAAYGKRITEVLMVKVKDITIDDTEKFIVTRFYILKSRPKAGIMKVRHKRLAIDHWTARFILPFIQGRDPEGHVLPSYGPSGHVHRKTAWLWLKMLDPDIWPHLFRHSLATMMAEQGATAFELKAFFDWDDIRTAMRYVRETEALSEKWAKRKF